MSSFPRFELFSHCLSNELSKIFSHGLSYFPKLWEIFPRPDLFSTTWNIFLRRSELSYFPTVWATRFSQSELINSSAWATKFLSLSCLSTVSHFPTVWTIFQRSEMFANNTWGPWRPRHRFHRRRCRPAGGWSGSSAPRSRRSTPGHETGGSFKGMISQYILQKLTFPIGTLTSTPWRDSLTRPTLYDSVSVHHKEQALSSCEWDKNGCYIHPKRKGFKTSRMLN